MRGGGYDESAADRLLREAGKLRRARDEYPCYTEEELRRTTARMIESGEAIEAVRGMMERG